MSRLVRSIQRFGSRQRRVWHFCIAAVLGLLWAAPALACTQPPGGVPNYTISQRVKAADVVLVGTVTQVTTLNVQDDTAEIEVEQYFKATGPTTVTITNFGSSAFCRSLVHEGDRWIFFADGDPNAVMYASYLGLSDAIATPDEDTIAQVLAAVRSRLRAYLPLLARGGDLVAAAPAGRDEGIVVGSALLVVASALLCSRLARAGWAWG
jgi:hypothetical protein